MKGTVIMENICFENRELSWLRFNERVLEEAEDKRLPLCERLTFLSIFQSNLDEFFMVRIGSLHDRMLLNKESRENKTNMTPGEQLEAAAAEINRLCIRRDAAYKELMKELEGQGITLVDFRNINKEAEKQLSEMFKTEFMPLLSTFVIGKKQSFPFLKNKEIYAIAVLSTKTEKQKIGIIPCGSDVFPRLIPIPGASGCYMLVEELILHYIPLFFKGYKVTGKTLARITRNADIDADRIYDEELNYREHMAEVVKLRQKLCPVRLELSRDIGKDIIAILCDLMKLDTKQVYRCNSPLDLSFFFKIEDSLRDRTELFYPPYHPQKSRDFDERRSIMGQIEKGDKLLHYPYQSIRPFLMLLSEAAHDPSVISIKMTLYRLARDSKVVESLVEAAENGKQVDVLVELKARFDEENNIEWSRRLERAGCHVIYGIEGLKVHSKLCLIIRKKGDEISYITQVGTGNYNEKTSRLYTDLSVMTASEAIGKEAAEVFHALTLGETVEHTQHLLVAPNCLQNRIIAMIDGEIAKVKKGREGYIRLKLNSLTDKDIMDKLIEASCAGVKIQMIIRGICCLKPGVKGYTENIEIISVVGRYLEHSRIYIFGKGRWAKYYISSADLMTRNTLRRVEVAVPITDRALKQRIEGVFSTIWSDNRQARLCQPDGTYIRLMPGEEEARSAQDILYQDAVNMSKKSRKTAKTAKSAKTVNKTE